MESNGGDEKAAHLLLIPDVQQHGHIIPMLRLAKQFAHKGVTVTFVISEADFSGIALTDSSPELQDLDFRVIRLSTPGKKATLSSRVLARMELQEAFEQQLMEKMVRDKLSGVAAGPTSILSDMFLPWTQDAAQKLQIPRYMFIPSGVIFARYMQGFVDLFEQGELRASEVDGNLMRFDGQVLIPGLPPLHYHELDLLAQVHTARLLLYCKSLWQSAGVLANSFLELEEKVIESWTVAGDRAIDHKKVFFSTLSYSSTISEVEVKYYVDANSGHLTGLLTSVDLLVPKIYPVGPLFSASISERNTTVVHGLDGSADKSLVWLGSQPTSSVLYVAFGSQAHLSPRQIDELALGLEASNQRFLWVFLQPKTSSKEETPSITNALPPGFKEQIGDRGYILTGWAPQRQILAHSSTGGFLTHAGWNSILESIMLGVPMIACPQGAEQYLNCRYLVDVLKVADEIRSGAENIVERSEIERAVHLLMGKSEGKAMRRKAEELQRKGAGAVATAGSRSLALEEFLHDISGNQRFRRDCC